MSLFDVIKYSDTNITNTKALMELPSDLISLYYVKVFKRSSGWDADTECWFLALNALTAQTDTRGLHKIFIKTLEEYNP